MVSWLVYTFGMAAVRRLQGLRYGTRTRRAADFFLNGYVNNLSNTSPVSWIAEYVREQ